ncbi:MAG TPA: transposase [Marinobacterium sp.]|nr:transposase [Marinobacterium sp.]
MNNHAHLPRRSFKSHQKVSMVKAALESGRPIAEVARRHNVNQNQLTRWIREYQNGASWRDGSDDAAVLLPIKIADQTCSTLSLPTKAMHTQESLPSLRATLEFESGVTVELTGLSGDDLKMMLEVLR